MCSTPDTIPAEEASRDLGADPVEHSSPLAILAPLRFMFLSSRDGGPSAIPAPGDGHCHPLEPVVGIRRGVADPRGASRRFHPGRGLTLRGVPPRAFRRRPTQIHDAIGRLITQRLPGNLPTTMPTTPSKPKKPAAKKPAAKKPAKTPPPRMTLAEAMRELEAAGSAQARKTYARHGAADPMFGVSFATLKAMTKRIDVDHELAFQLWETGNFDAQDLAVKIVDPAKMSPADLDRWAREVSPSRMCGGYASMLAAEGPHGPTKVAQWLASSDPRERSAAWTLLGQLACRDEAMPDTFFEECLAEIEYTIHSAPNFDRDGMNRALITIGGRTAALRKAAIAAAKRIGKVEVDHGDTACETSDAVEYIEKTWAHSKSKGFESPAAQERKRETPRRRC